MSRNPEPTALRPRQATNTDTVAYQRGISVRQIAKGALTRFMPGSVVGAAGWLYFQDPGLPGYLLSMADVVLGLASLHTVGFAVALLGLRRWLYPDAGVDGSRSFVAGLMSPLLLFIVGSMDLTLNLSLAFLPVIPSLVGMVLAIAMFFAWLSPTPEHMLATEYHVDGLDALESPEGNDR